MRGAIRAASDSPEVAQVIAAHADKTGWGGHREVAGRPRAKMKKVLTWLT